MDVYFCVLGGSATNSYATTNLTVTDFTGLQSAFTTANANTAEDYVVTINGTIQATAPLTLTNAKMTLAGSGTIQGYDSTASGNTKSSLIRASGSALTLDGVTISGHKGYAAVSLRSSSFTMKSGAIKDNTSTQAGGAINSTNSYITMAGGEISNNTTADGGGGIHARCYVYSAPTSTDLLPNMNTANFKMTGGKISGNTASYGGGISIFGTNCKADINGGEISNNTVLTTHGMGVGGGIVAADEADVILNSGTVTGNSGTIGGGIFVDCQPEKATVSSAEIVGGKGAAGDCFTMNGGTVNDNNATYGGGISASNGSSFTINDGEITNNTARSFGGGIFLMPDGTANITGGNIADNTAARGGKGVFVGTDTTLNLSSDAFINKNNDVYLDGTDTAVNVLSKLNKVTRENPIALTPSDTTTVSTKAGVVGNKLVNYFAKASALEADMQDYFILSDYVSTDAHIVQSDFTSEENYLILGKRMVSLFLKFSGIVGAENETISLTKNDIITKSPAYQAVIAKYAKKGYTLEFYFDENHTNLLPADQAIVDDTTLYARYVKNPNTLDNVAIYAIIGIATIAGASILLKSQKRSRR